MNDLPFDLRDYFAAKAMDIIAVQYPSTDAIGCAELAYEYADAMMQVRLDDDSRN